MQTAYQPFRPGFNESAPLTVWVFQVFANFSQHNDVTQHDGCMDPVSDVCLHASFGLSFPIVRA